MKTNANSIVLLIRDMSRNTIKTPGFNLFAEELKNSIIMNSRKLIVSSIT
jgi:hypothetical protein